MAGDSWVSIIATWITSGLNSLMTRRRVKAAEGLANWRRPRRRLVVP
jgi:hypothetical protein